MQPISLSLSTILNTQIIMTTTEEGTATENPTDNVGTETKVKTLLICMAQAHVNHCENIFSLPTSTLCGLWFITPTLTLSVTLPFCLLMSHHFHSNTSSKWNVLLDLQILRKCIGHTWNCISYCVYQELFHFHRYIFGGILDKQSKSIYHISIGDLVKCNTEVFFGGGVL